MKNSVKIILLMILVLGLIIGSFGLGYAAEKNYEFRLVWSATGQAFLRPVIKGMEDAAKLLGNVNVKVVGPVEDSVPKTVATFNAMVDTNVDAIITAIGDPTSWVKPATRAKEKGIPVIACCIDDITGNTPRMAFVGSDSIGQGEIMGKAMLEYGLPEGSKIALFQHMAHSQLKGRIDGVKNILAGKGFEIESIITGSEMTKAIGVIEAYLLANPEVKGIYGVDGITTPACAQVLLNHPELKGKVHTGGTDLIPITLQAIQQGVADFALDQNPYLYGFYPVISAWLYLKYGIDPCNINTGMSRVDISNVNKMIELAEQGYK